MLGNVGQNIATFAPGRTFRHGRAVEPISRPPVSTPLRSYCKAMAEQGIFKVSILTKGYLSEIL